MAAPLPSMTACREVFPGRFKMVKPTAVELHTTMDLLCDTPTTVVLTPDTTNEQTFLPAPASLRASLLLADRGYLDLHYMRRVQNEGELLIRAKAGMNPQVLDAFREDGKRLRSLRNRTAQGHSRHTAHTPAGGTRGAVARGRVPAVSAPDYQLEPPDKGVLLLADQPGAPALPADTICRAYKWRWQVELLFKE